MLSARQFGVDTGGDRDLDLVRERVDKRGFVGGAELATCLDHSLELGALDATGTRHLQPVICSEVLAGVRHRVDRTSGLSALLAGDQGADENDPLTLLARDACPVVWVGGVREVLVLLELVHAGLEHMGDPQALLTDVQQVLDRHLLGAVDDVLDHGAGVEVLEVEDLLVAVGVGHLEEPVLLGLGVHPFHGGPDHPVHARLTLSVKLGEVVGTAGQLGNDVLREDVARRLCVGTLDLNLHVQAPRSKNRRVDHVLAVGGTYDYQVLQTFDAVDLAQQRRDDRVLDTGGDPRSAGAEQRVHLVEEDDDRRTAAGLPVSYTHLTLPTIYSV